MWQWGLWAWAEWHRLQTPGRNQSGLGATNRSAQNSHDPGLATECSVPKGHKMGRGFGPVRQASACPSGFLQRLGTILLSLLPIHSPPHLTLSIPSAPLICLAKVTHYARWSRTVWGLG